MRTEAEMEAAHADYAASLDYTGSCYTAWALAVIWARGGRVPDDWGPSSAAAGAWVNDPRRINMRATLAELKEAEPARSLSAWKAAVAWVEASRLSPGASEGGC
jgi:hypothetical protein